MRDFRKVMKVTEEARDYLTSGDYVNVVAAGIEAALLDIADEYHREGSIEKSIRNVVGSSQCPAAPVAQAPKIEGFIAGSVFDTPSGRDVLCQTGSGKFQLISLWGNRRTDLVVDSSQPVSLPDVEFLAGGKVKYVGLLADLLKERRS